MNVFLISSSRVGILLNNILKNKYPFSIIYEQVVGKFLFCFAPTWLKFIIITYRIQDKVNNEAAKFTYHILIQTE